MIEQRNDVYIAMSMHLLLLLGFGKAIHILYHTAVYSTRFDKTQHNVKRPMNQGSSVFLLSSDRRQQLCELRTGERTLRLDRAVTEALHQTLLHTQCNRISAVR